MNSNQRRETSAFIPIIGLAAWLGGIVLLQPGWAGSLFLLAPLVAVPLALRLLEIAAGTRWCFLVGAVLLIPSYACEPGILATSFTLPWLLLCAGFALAELYRVPKRADWAAVLMRGYLVVGAGWLTLARLGLRPLGFEDVIVHATALHFHYAGFVLPALLVRLARVDRKTPTRWALAGVLAGMPLVAAGITLSVWQIRWLESAATLFMALACWLAAARQGCFALTVQTRLAKGLLLASSAALAVAMVLACLYAGGQLLGTPWLDIPFMLRFHGSLQVFGFALPALLAWALLNDSPRVATRGLTEVM